jgi:hypothetical protein
VRDANEVTEHGNAALPAGAGRRPLRCECGDRSCEAEVSPTHAEYEDVRSSGSHFIISVDHENPENACVLHQNERHAVVDVVVADARYAVLARNPRHAWVEPA